MESHANSIEGFWDRLKLSIRGIHVHVPCKASLEVREGARVPLQSPASARDDFPGPVRFPVTIALSTRLNLCIAMVWG